LNSLELSKKMDKWMIQTQTNYKDLSEEDKEKYNKITKEIN
jgi:hypothetical protein